MTTGQTQTVRADEVRVGDRLAERGPLGAFYGFSAPVREALSVRPGKRHGVILVGNGGAYHAAPDEDVEIAPR